MRNVYGQSLFRLKVIIEIDKQTDDTHTQTCNRLTVIHWRQISGR